MYQCFGYVRYLHTHICMACISHICMVVLDMKDIYSAIYVLHVSLIYVYGCVGYERYLLRHICIVCISDICVVVLDMRDIYTAIYV